MENSIEATKVLEKIEILEKNFQTLNEKLDLVDKTLKDRKKKKPSTKK